MDDLISRQAVLDCFNGKVTMPYDMDTGLLKVYLQTVVDAINNLPGAGKTETVTEFADRCRECGKTKQKWIPVSESLPEEDIECLVVDDEGEFGVGFYRDDVGAWDSLNWGWLERKDDVDNYDAYYMPCGIGKVVAWMPLPEPYKAQEGEQE